MLGLAWKQGEGWERAGWFGNSKRPDNKQECQHLSCFSDDRVICHCYYYYIITENVYILYNAVKQDLYDVLMETFFC